MISSLNRLSKSETAHLIYLQAKGRAKQLIEFLDIQALDSDQVLDDIFNVYGQAFKKLGHERVDETHGQWETAHRRAGQ